MGIIIKPLVTEKMTGISEKSNRFGFVVRPNANKFARPRARAAGRAGSRLSSLMLWLNHLHA